MLHAQQAVTSRTLPSRAKIITFSQFGAHVCTTVTKWMKDKSELTCIVAQRNNTVSIRFRNRGRQTITELQVKEMRAFIDAFTGVETRNLVVVGKVEVNCTLTLQP